MIPRCDDDCEMDNNSTHSATSTSSVVSTNTATSLHDVELADSETDTEGAAKNDHRMIARKIQASRCFQRLSEAREQFRSSDFHGMNPAVLSILTTEAAERFAYYGFRASLVLYFTQELRMDDTTAISLFAFASYVANVTPIFGALLGDGKLGRFRTIVAFGFLYWLGLIALTHAAFLANHTTSQLKVKRIVTMVGLALICTGTGGIKPCVSIFGADQVNVKRSSLDDSSSSISATQNSHATHSTSLMTIQELEKVRTFFSLFSMCINLGAVASFLVIPTIKGSFGFGAAFLVPTVFMCFAIFVFTSQRHNYTYRPHNPHGSSLYTTFRLCLWLMHKNFWDNKFISKNFPSLEPGPVPIPSEVPKVEPTIVEGIRVRLERDRRRMERDDNSSLSTLSSGMRSLSQSLERRFGRSLSRSRSRSRQSSDSRMTLDTANLPADHPLQTAHRNSTRGSGLAVPRGSPNVSMSPRQKSRKSAEGRPSVSPQPSPSVSGASLHTNDRYLAQHLSDAARALNVMPIFAMLPCFWMLYDQQGSVWTLQASRMNLYGIIQPEQVNVLNPIGLFVLIPVFDKAVYPALQKREIDISPLRRMGWGMVLVSFAFFISGIVEYVIDYRSQNGLSQISVLWQIPQIGLMTIAEIFVSVTGLEFAYSVSPDRLKSFIMAAYLGTIAKGDFWGGVLYSTVFRDTNQAFVLHIFAFLMMINLVLYGYVVRSWELRDGVVSWDLFDKILETETKHRPCWMSHQRQVLRESTQAPVLVIEKIEKEPKGPSERSERRGRGRWRRRDKKPEKISKKNGSGGSKKGGETGGKRRRPKPSAQQ